jgi:hypothetical protein
MKDVVTVKVTLDVEEARGLLGKYGIKGSPIDPSKGLLQNLSDAIRDDVLGRSKKKGRNRRSRAIPE